MKTSIYKLLLQLCVCEVTIKTIVRQKGKFLLFLFCCRNCQNFRHACKTKVKRKKKWKKLMTSGNVHISSFNSKNKFLPRKLLNSTTKGCICDLFLFFYNSLFLVLSRYNYVNRSFQFIQNGTYVWGVYF